MERGRTHARMSYRTDCFAVMEMPHKLMITAVVMAMVMPLIIEGTDTVIKHQQEQELKAECWHLADRIALLYHQGLNASSIVELKLPEGTVLVSAGASLYNGHRAEMIQIQYRLAGGQLRRIAVKSGDNYISMCSERDNAFKIIQGGDHAVKLRKCQIHSDLNGDGILPDFYIELAHV